MAALASSSLPSPIHFSSPTLKSSSSSISPIHLSVRPSASNLSSLPRPSSSISRSDFSSRIALSYSSNSRHFCFPRAAFPLVTFEVRFVVLSVGSNDDGRSMFSFPLFMTSVFLCSQRSLSLVLLFMPAFLVARNSSLKCFL